MSMTGVSTLPVAMTLARRYGLGLVRIPATLVPVVLMPVFFIVAFGGSFSGLTDVPGFPTDNILNWMTPFAALQGCVFAGFGASLYTARDLETGFFDRLLASPAPPRAIVLGPVLYATARAFLPLVIVVPVALVGGARFEGGPAGLATLVIAALGLSVLACLWGLGVMYRLRTQRAGALVQIVITLAMFLSVGTVPLVIMEGWLHTVARLNPVTPVFDLARQGLLGPVTMDDTVPGLLSLALMGVVLSAWAWLGFGRLAR
jgi:ABC-2 type transport system permease protein